MSEYYARADGGYKFTELIEDEDFRKDLVKFFQGGRYKYSDEEMDQKGWDGLMNDFAEHMRWQAANEVTAIRDLAYVKSKEYDQDGKDAFGRLTEAYQRSDGGGTGFVAGFLDYAGAALSSPTTIATVLTGGLGIGSKLAGRGTSALAAREVAHLTRSAVMAGASRKAAEAAVRREAARQAAKAAGKPYAVRLAERSLGTQMLRELPKSAGREALGSAARTAALDAPIEAWHNYSIGKSREYTSPTGYTYTAPMLAGETLLTAGAGAALGGLSGFYNQRAVNQMYDNVYNAAVARKSLVLKTRDTSNDALRRAIKASPDATKTSMEETLKGVLRLDPDEVAQGDEIRKRILDDLLKGSDANADLPVSIGMDYDTLRNIVASKEELRMMLEEGLSLADGLPVMRSDETITSWIGRMMEANPEVASKEVRAFMQKFDLTPREFRLMTSAQVSEAGRILGVESQNKQWLDSIMEVRRRGAPKDTPTSRRAAARRARKAKAEKSPPTGRRLWDAANSLDAAQIGMMTTQLGTASANTIGSGLNYVAEASDSFFRGLIRAGTGDFAGFKNSMLEVADSVRALNITSDEIRTLTFQLRADRPDVYTSVIHESVRADKAVGYDSALVRGVRKMNIFNIASDSAYKEAVFWRSLNSTLRDLGEDSRDLVPWRSVREMQKAGASVKDLPDGILDKAIDDALRITMQRSFRDDPSLYGTIFSKLEEVNHNVPFLVSQGFGMPFPRFMANMIEMSADYSGLGLAYGIGDKALRAIGTTGFETGTKTMEDRIARAATGFMATAAGYYLASGREEGQSYSTLAFGEGDEAGGIDVKRAAGPWLLQLYLGDLLYRMNHDMPYTKTAVQAGEDLKEMGFAPDMGNKTSIAYLLWKFAEEPNDENGQKLTQGLGDYAATFTYPITPLRDIAGMVDPESAPTPYGRNLLYDDLGWKMNRDQFFISATKMFPDLKAWDVLRTRGYGEYDPPAYSPFHPEPVNSTFPLARQFGVSQNQSVTPISEELGRLQIAEYKAFGRRIPNPTEDYVVREIMSQTSSEYFEMWRKQEPLPDFGNVTYDQLDDEDKRLAIVSFIGDMKGTILDDLRLYREAEIYSGDAGRVRRQASYINWEYSILEKEYQRTHGQKPFDRVVRHFTNGEYNTADEYIFDFPDGSVDGDEYVESIQRKLQLMGMAEEFFGGGG